MKIVTVDQYIANQPIAIAERLTNIRELFHKVLPHTEESIRYGMPAFTVSGYHLYIGAYKSHIGMYPMYGIPELEEAIAPYRAEGTKDSLHFKHDAPLPLDLIEKIIHAKDKKSSHSQR
jgi:uncharacterized protein YdhG (YjbR/CyaY superfamily)